jgi:ATP-dependent Clp protease ATP-binding subunit ClpA
MALENPSNRPFTSRANKIITAAQALAISRGHDFIGAEHLFLALARDHEAIPTIVMDDAAITETLVAKIEGIMESPGYKSPATVTVLPSGDVVDRTSGRTIGKLEKSEHGDYRLKEDE